MSTTDSLLEAALAAYRLGRDQPASMSQAATGAQGQAMAQSIIRTRLEAGELLEFVKIRDASRSAAGLVRQGDPQKAAQLLEELLSRWMEQPLREEVSLLGQLWVTQAQAYASAQSKDAAQAEGYILKAMEIDARLENHGYYLFHLHRIHLLHLLTRTWSASGKLREAVCLLEAGSEYVAGRRPDLPVGENWGEDRITKVPLALRDAMRNRLAGEVGLVIALAGEEKGAEIFAEFQSWRHGSERPALIEMLEWGRLKEAFVSKDWPSFLERCRAFLSLGRRETTLWHAAVLDLYRYCEPRHPDRAQAFRSEIQSDIPQWEAISPEIFPRRWAALFKHLKSAAASGPTTFSTPDSPRRFRIFNVGLPRTGTRSIAAIFSNYRSQQEFQFREAMQQILAWKLGRCDEQSVRSFLHARDQAGHLEMDAAFFHQYYLPLLMEEFPEARFIVTIRDAASWINSFTDMLLRWRRHYEVIGQPLPAWQSAVSKLLFRDFDADVFASPERLREDFPRIAGSLAALWAESNNTILKTLPADRTLVLRTSEISQSLEALANFAGVKADSLIAESSLVNTAPYRFDWIGSSPEAANAVLSQPLPATLSELFPQAGAEDYLRQFPEAGDWTAYLQRHRDFRNPKVER